MGALTKRIEFEIRMRFELGEDLNKLATIYRISLSTLNKRKKIAEIKGDPWIKGFRSKQAYEDFSLKEKKNKEELLNLINEEVTKHLAHTRDVIKSYEAEEMRAINQGETPKIYKSVEEAVGRRIDNIARIAEIKRDIIGVYTPEKQIAINKLNIELELRRKELEARDIEAQIQKEKVETELEIIKLKKMRLEKQVASEGDGTKLLE